MSFRIAVGELDKAVAEEISARLFAFNQASVDRPPPQSFQVALRDAAGTLVGGITAALQFDVMRIDDVFIDEAARRGGWGTKLMDAIEAEGMRRGARLACLTTFSWQARPFYEKRGYTMFAELPYNGGEHHIYWLKKTLCA